MALIKKETVQSLLKTMPEIINIRHYQNRPIPQEIENDLFYAFTTAYSSGNAQPWEILVIDNKYQCQKVIEATLDPDLNKESYGGQTWIEDAPLVCVVMIDKRRSIARLGERGFIFSIEDVSFAIQNFRLIAHLHSLKTACVREFDVDTLKTNLVLPWYVEPIAILTAGYGERKKGLPPKLQLSDVIKRGEWK